MVARASPLGRPFADLRAWDQGQGLVPEGEAARRAQGKQITSPRWGAGANTGRGRGWTRKYGRFLCDRKREGSHYWPAPVVTLAGEHGA